MPGKNRYPLLGWHCPAGLAAWARAEADRRSVPLADVLTEALSAYKDAADYHGSAIHVGDRVEAYLDGVAFTARIAAVKTPSAGCEGHVHLAVIREADGAEFDRSSDSVVLMAPTNGSSPHA